MTVQARKQLITDTAKARGFIAEWIDLRMQKARLRRGDDILLVDFYRGCTDQYVVERISCAIDNTFPAVDRFKRKQIITETARSRGWEAEWFSGDVMCTRLRRGNDVLQVEFLEGFTDEQVIEQVERAVNGLFSGIPFAPGASVQLENYVPAWLLPLISDREKRILADKQCRFLQEDDDGERLAGHQQIIESPTLGRFIIDGQQRKIIG